MAGESTSWPPRRTDRWRGRLTFTDDSRAWNERQTFPAPTPRIFKFVNGRKVLVTLAELEVDLLETMWKRST